MGENCTDSVTSLLDQTVTEMNSKSYQELQQEDGNLVLSEGDDELNECHKDRAEAEVDGDEDYFFPSPEELEKARAPEVGMSFATLQEAQHFINVYGQVAGYRVVKGTNYKNKKITFQCDRRGKNAEREARQRKRRRTAIERTGCRMKVLVKLLAGRWEISTVVHEHNHPLWSSPLLIRFFMSHKYMSEDERNFSRILQESRIKPAQIMEIFRSLRGTLPTRKINVNNLEQSDRPMNNRNTDIESVLEFVRRMQKEQPGFYYSMRTGEGSTVSSIFWTDTRARLDYALYGDFISCDTAYSTVQYNMPLVLLLGINGEGDIIVFGWALLEDVKADTFSWLLKTFLDVMDGKKPSIIITHHDSALQRSVAEIFPSVFHRFNMWHVMRQAAAEFGGFMANKPGMEDELRCLITNSLTTDEFEDGWNAMLEKYDASSSTHLKLIYQTRLMWAPVYSKHVFCPFLRSAGCSDTSKSIFKDHVQREDTIETFISQYDIFQEHVVSIERDRHESALKKPMYCTRQLIERHAADIYTTGIFLKFQKELLDATAFGVFEKEKDVLYTVKKLLDYEEAEFLKDSFSVEVDLENNMFNCICSKFERDGILCCHVLRLFTQFGINKIPEQYIKLRWTKKFSEKDWEQYFRASTGSDGSRNDLCYNMLMKKMEEISAAVSKYSNHSKIFAEELERIQQNMMNGSATS